MDGLVSNAGLRLEGVIHSVVVAAIVVDNNQQVAFTVVVVYGVETEEVPALRAVERAGVDFYRCGWIERHHVHIV